MTAGLREKNTWFFGLRQACYHIGMPFQNGLTSAEAAVLLQKNGPNILPRKRKKTALEFFLIQFVNPLILILLAAGALTIFLNEWLEAVVILAAVLANALMGFWQEWKAQDVLSRMESYVRTRVRVRRDGREHEIPAEELVVGDLMLVARGERVSADARLVNASGLTVNESILTGESLAVEKKAEDMIRSGTLVDEGLGEALITATGKDTEFARIAELAGTGQEAPTPLQQAVGSLSRILGLASIGISVLLFWIGLANGRTWLDMLLISVAVGVSMVPEGLPIALTVILAAGVERLAKRQGIVRQLLAAETLGSTTLILTDKTGTLTQADLSLSSITALESDEKELLSLAALSAEAIIENPEDKPSEWRFIGRPVEVALVRGAAQKGIFQSELLKNNPVIERIPFDSTKKYGGIVINADGHEREVLVGAPDVLSDTPLDIERQTASGERLIGIALRDLPDGPIRLQGLIGFRDPVRPGVHDAVDDIAKSGVTTAMVTGDHPGTALAIAKDVGISTSGVLTGKEIDALDDSQLQKRIAGIRVFARVTPEQKWRLVRAFRALGESVAVTGDGVNDAPALKEAEIGVAMGSGTDVAKDVADLVILDNNFKTIVAAIHEGRRMLSNIRKVVAYLLSNAIGDLVLIGGSLILSLPAPIGAIQILFINFFTDSFPAIAYAFEGGEEAQGRRLGQNKIIDPSLRKIVVIGSLGASVIVFAAYVFLLRFGWNLAEAKTMAFASLGFSTLFIAFFLRRLNLPFWRIPWDNKYMTLGLAIGSALMLGAVYIPALQPAFESVSLSPTNLLLTLGISFIAALPIELAKWIDKKTKNG